MLDTSSFVLCAIQVLIAFAARQSLGSWLSPGAFFAGFWMVAGSAAALVAAIAFDLKVHSSAVAVITLFSAAAWLGDECCGRVDRSGGSERTDWITMPVSEGMLRRGTVVLAFAALFIPFRLIGDFDRSVVELASATAWMSFAPELAYARYQGTYTEPLDVRMLMAGLYLAALLGGVLLSRASRRSDRVIAWTPTVVGIVIAAITTTKTSFLYPMIMTLAAFLAWPKSSGQRSRDVGNVRTAMRWLALAVAIMAATVGSLVVRYSLTSFDEWTLIWDRLAGYAVGHIVALSAWLEWEGMFGTQDLTWGASSFVGQYSLLAGVERIPGVYSTLVYNDYAGESNVYTVFRGLISDFSLPGAVAICMLVSAVAGRHYRKLRDAGWSAPSYLVVAAFYLFCMWSHVINVFSYNSILVAEIGFACVVGLSARRAKSGAASTLVLPSHPPSI